MEFLSRLEQAWDVCDKFDLQTEIWRGRILKSVRDRENAAGKDVVRDFCSGFVNGKSVRPGRMD